MADTNTGRLTGKIVTGARGELCEGTARLFAGQGSRVAVLDIRGDAAERIAADWGGDAVDRDDVARACLYLAREGPEFIPGVLLPFDGGRTV